MVDEAARTTPRATAMTGRSAGCRSDRMSTIGADRSRCDSTGRRGQADDGESDRLMTERSGSRHVAPPPPHPAAAGAGDRGPSAPPRRRRGRGDRPARSADRRRPSGRRRSAATTQRHAGSRPSERRANAAAADATARGRDRHARPAPRPRSAPGPAPADPGRPLVGDEDRVPALDRVRHRHRGGGRDGLAGARRAGRLGLDQRHRSRRASAARHRRLRHRGLRRHLAGSSASRCSSPSSTSS